MLKKQSLMPLLLVILAGFMLSSTACGSKFVKNMPEPIYGKDIIQVNKDQPAPYKGTLFSDFYLNSYLQWKDEVQSP